MLETKVMEEAAQKAIAKNVRIMMNVQDVGLTHVVHLLKEDRGIVRQKIGGSLPFTEDNLKTLAKYFETSVEKLCEYEDKDPTAEIDEKAGPVLPSEDIPPSVTESSEASQKAPSRQADLLKLTQNDPELARLLEHTYLAILSGKIVDLRFYLRNNILPRAMQLAGVSATSLSEEKRAAFIDFFVIQFEGWKNDLITNLDEVTRVMLTSNEAEEVMQVLVPIVGEDIGNYLRSLIITLNQGDKTIDINYLSFNIERAIEQLVKIKRMLDDYQERH